jgi:hypothetical protein
LTVYSLQIFQYGQDPKKAIQARLQRHGASLEKQRGAPWIVKNRRLPYKAQKGR